MLRSFRRGGRACGSGAGNGRYHSERSENLGSTQRWRMIATGRHATRATSGRFLSLSVGGFFVHSLDTDSRCSLAQLRLTWCATFAQAMRTMGRNNPLEYSSRPYGTLTARANVPHVLKGARGSIQPAVVVQGPKMNLCHRRRQPELMDQPGLDAVEHAAALAGLERINRLSRSSAIVWGAMRTLLREGGHRPLAVMDVASGGGDVALAVARRARRAGIQVRIEGYDISPTAVDLAHHRAQRERADNVAFFPLNVVREPLPGGYDVVMCSLFLHHLSDEQAIDLLGKMAGAARSLVVVNDLRRSRLAYGVAWVGCRLLSRSPIVHVDGPSSVAAAFTPDEAIRLARTAGLKGAKVSCRWPQRFLLSWRRP